MKINKPPIKITPTTEWRVALNPRRQYVWKFNLARETWVDRCLETTIHNAISIGIILVWLGVLAFLFSGCGVDMTGLDGSQPDGVLIRQIPDGGAGGKGGMHVSSMGGQGGMAGIGGTGNQGGGGQTEPMANGGQGGTVSQTDASTMDATDYTICPTQAAGCVWVGICGGKTCCVNPAEVEAYKCR